MKVQFMVMLEMTEEPKNQKAMEDAIKRGTIRELNENGLTHLDDPARVTEVTGVHYAKMVTLVNTKFRDTNPRIND